MLIKRSIKLFHIWLIKNWLFYCYNSLFSAEQSCAACANNGIISCNHGWMKFRFWSYFLFILLSLHNFSFFAQLHSWAKLLSKTIQERKIMLDVTTKVGNKRVQEGLKRVRVRCGRLWWLEKVNISLLISRLRNFFSGHLY